MGMGCKVVVPTVMNCQIEYVSSDSDVGTPCGNRAVAECAECGAAICADCRTWERVSHRSRWHIFRSRLEFGRILEQNESEKTRRGSQREKATLLFSAGRATCMWSEQTQQVPST